MDKKSRKSQGKFFENILRACFWLFALHFMPVFAVPVLVIRRSITLVNESPVQPIKKIGNNSDIELFRRNTQCPITHEIMHDPVYIEGDSSGFRYERAAITHWLSHSNTNPMTGEICSVSELRSDNQLRDYLAAQNDVRPSAPPYSDYLAAQNEMRPSAPPYSNNIARRNSVRSSSSTSKNVSNPQIAVTSRNTECPITGEELRDPVYINGDSSGTRYERTAIREWLSRSNTNPMTRQRCSAKDLRSDNELRNYMQEQRKNPTLRESDKEPTQAGSEKLAQVKQQSSNTHNQAILRENYAKSRAQTESLRKLSQEAKGLQEQATQSQNQAAQLNSDAESAQHNAVRDRQLADDKAQAYQTALDARNSGHADAVSDQKLEYLKKDADKSAEYAQRSSKRAQSLKTEAQNANQQASRDSNNALQASNKYQAEKSKYDSEVNKGQAGNESANKLELSKVKNTTDPSAHKLEEKPSPKTSSEEQNLHNKVRSTKNDEGTSSSSESSSLNISKESTSSHDSSSSDIGTDSASSSLSSTSEATSSASSEASSSSVSSSGSSASTAPSPFSTSPKPD